MSFDNFDPTLGLAQLLFPKQKDDDDEAPSLPVMEEEKPESPPMLEDARAAAERASVSNKKKYGMASTILTSPAGQALGAGDIKKSLAGGLLT